MPAMTIAKLANAAGVGVETVRYYQRRGLMQTPPRPDAYSTDGSIRRYDETDLARLKFIRSAQTAGFSLSEIGQLLELDRVANRRSIRQLAEQRIAALDEKIRELRSARRSLIALADQCRGGADGACPIIDAFETPA